MSKDKNASHGGAEFISPCGKSFYLKIESRKGWRYCNNDEYSQIS